MKSYLGVQIIGLIRVRILMRCCEGRRPSHTGRGGQGRRAGGAGGRYWNVMHRRGKEGRLTPVLGIHGRAVHDGGPLALLFPLAVLTPEMLLVRPEPSPALFRLRRLCNGIR